MQTTVEHETTWARRSDDRMVAGVAGGIADRLAVPDTYVRAAFAVLALVWGLGAVFYVAAWAAMRPSDHIAPATAFPKASEMRSRLTGMGIGLFGLLVVLRSLLPWPGDRLVWPLSAVIVGAAVLMDQRAADPRSMAARLFDQSGGWVRTRALVGAAILVGGVALLGASAVPDIGLVLLAVVLTMVGALFMFGPWLWRMGKDLATERRERIRQAERADMAAHLHDSVLQTLALIQRTDDPRRMVTLARGQERELRRWLFESTAQTDGATLSASLQQLADRTEEDFAVPVEVVTVGDHEMDEHVQALVMAAGEALVNAAKHSGADRVSIYSEVGDDAIEVWVSDQGKGFDPDGIESDRRGITESIVGRMRRHGGSAVVTTEPGEGTELHLRLPKERS